MLASACPFLYAQLWPKATGLMLCVLSLRDPTSCCTSKSYFLGSELYVEHRYKTWTHPPWRIRREGYTPIARSLSLLLTMLCPFHIEQLMLITLAEFMIIKKYGGYYDTRRVLIWSIVEWHLVWCTTYFNFSSCCIVIPSIESCSGNAVLTVCIWTIKSDFTCICIFES